MDRQNSVRQVGDSEDNVVHSLPSEYGLSSTSIDGPPMDSRSNGRTKNALRLAALVAAVGIIAGSIAIGITVSTKSRQQTPMQVDQEAEATTHQDTQDMIPGEEDDNIIHVPASVVESQEDHEPYHYQSSGDDVPDYTSLFTDYSPPSKNVSAMTHANYGELFIDLDNNETLGVILDHTGNVSDFIVANDISQFVVARAGSASCPNPNHGVWRIVLVTDKYPWETYFSLTNNQGIVVASGPPSGQNYARETKYIGQMCLPRGRYSMKIGDKNNDGHCCGSTGQGKMTVYVNGEKAAETNDEDFSELEYPLFINKQASSSVVVPLQTSELTTCTTSFTVATYNAIDRDIATLKNDIQDAQTRAHFLGGIVRLAAHDFMTFDPGFDPMTGADGCIEMDHDNNAGLDTIWCTNCKLTVLHRLKYSHISKADFWVACANVVIRQTSVNNGLDLKNTFRWGRVDATSCRGSGERLPRPAGCDEIEEVFLMRMGLTWADAAALMGAHTLGRGDIDFSGHHGTWVASNREAQVFDRDYYVQLFDNPWRMRNRRFAGGIPQDWTTGRGSDSNERVMLNTDVCLAFDIDQTVRQDIPCCTRLDKVFPDGMNACVERDAARRRCPMYSSNDPIRAARNTAREFLGGDGNSRFYVAFEEAWRKATTVGQRRLRSLTQTCES